MTREERDLLISIIENSPSNMGMLIAATVRQNEIIRIIKQFYKEHNTD